MFESLWGHEIRSEPGLRIPNMLDAAIDGEFKGIFIQGEDIAQSDPNTVHVMAALTAMEVVVVQDLFLNETPLRPRVPARHQLLGEGRHVHQRRAADQPRAPGDAAAQRQARVAGGVRAVRSDGRPMQYDEPSQIMDEIAALTPPSPG